MKKIFFVGFGQESTTFSPVLTDRADFRTRSTSDLVFAPLYERAAQLDIDLISIGFFWGTPGGPIRRDAFESLSAEIILEATVAAAEHKFDGILLALHGSMQVEGLGHGEADFIKKLRVVLGEDLLVASSIDLHGNLNPELIDLVHIPCAYRTAPHRDGIETMSRALTVLNRCIKENIKPIRAFVQIPILLPGEKAMTTHSPAKELYEMLPTIDQQDYVLTSSILVGFAWADIANTGASIIVVGYDNVAAVQKEADTLARAFWSEKERFSFAGNVMSIDAATETCRESSETIFLTDSGDNVTAGAPGDSALLLGRLMTAGLDGVLVAGICDAAAVKACAGVGIGGVVERMVGGSLLSGVSVRTNVSGRVSYLGDESPPSTAIIELAGLSLILTADRVPFTSPKQLYVFAKDPLKQKVFVVKLGYLYPEFADIAPREIMVMTPGASSQDVETFKYTSIRRPIFPLDPAWDWEPAVRISL